MIQNPTEVSFPLEGEWEAELSPAEEATSHRTDQLAQTYAFDFVQIERKYKGLKFFKDSIIKYFIFGVSLENCYGWGQPIYAPFDGIVVESRDGFRERKWLHLLRDIAVVYKNALTFDVESSSSLQPILGNYLILKMKNRDIFAMLAHIKTGSIIFPEGAEIITGQKIAEVGHSGNSTAPHLHFQLMDNSNLLTAKGLPCVFTEYMSLAEPGWKKISQGVPKRREFIRNVV